MEIFLQGGAGKGRRGCKMGKPNRIKTERVRVSVIPLPERPRGCSPKVSHRKHGLAGPGQDRHSQGHVGMGTFLCPLPTIRHLSRDSKGVHR